LDRVSLAFVKAIDFSKKRDMREETNKLNKNITLFFDKDIAFLNLRGSELKQTSQSTHRIIKFLLAP
jgi:hypothetical protein